MSKNIFENPLPTEQQTEELAKKRLESKISTLNEPPTREAARVPDLQYINIPLENLPTGGIYYPPNTTINIKAASTKVIRHFSTMNETDYLNIDDKLNSVLEHCVKIYMPNKLTYGLATYKDIYELDRMYLILAIKELTFIKSDNTLSMQLECPSCGTKHSVDITKENFPRIELPEVIASRWNAETLTFDFKMADEDGSDVVIKLKLPVLGMTQFAKSYARAKSYQGGYLDDSLIKTLMYLDKDYSKLNDKVLRELDLEMSQTWSLDKFSLLDKLVDMLDQYSTAKIKHICNQCGEESGHDLQFQQGYKSLFIHTDILSKLV